MEKPVFPKKPFRGHGGASVPHRKNTSQTETLVLPLPSQIILPMSQHIGRPCIPTVKPGDHVYIGQTVAEPSAFVGAPIHSSVSGTVKKLAQIRLANGSKGDALFIEPDGKQEVLPDITPPSLASRAELLEAIKASGAVGLGGAGFPTHVKLNVEPTAADTLIINAAECEPYITSDHREILENSWNIMSGVYTLLDVMGFSRVIIGVEENKPDAIEMLTKIAESAENDPLDRVKVLKLHTRYPQGAEKMLIHACTKRIVPAGKLPIDAGCVVLNITTLSCLANFFKTGMPLVTKRITVDGSAITKPCNLIVPIGTPIKDVLDFCGAESVRKVLYGGPMMGVAVSDTSLPIMKQNNAILAFTEDEACLPPETDCILCGRCVRSCPMKLQPVMIARAAARKDCAALEKLQVMNCIECGCCTYNCPAKRYITQQMRVAKAVLRESKQTK